MVVHNTAPEEYPPEEELDHGELPATDDAPRTPSGSPGSQATH